MEMNGTTTYIFSIAGAILLALASIYSADQSIQNQDTMLCNSAKVSGNREYLTKCQCFYNTGDIICLQKNN